MISISEARKKAPLEKPFRLKVFPDTSSGEILFPPSSGKSCCPFLSPNPFLEPCEIAD